MKVTISMKDTGLTARESSKGREMLEDLSGKSANEFFVENVRTIHAIIAKEVLQEELQAGFDPKYTRIVDGKIGRREEDVKFLGRISYQSRAYSGDFAKLITEMYEEILKLSPKTTGEYEKSNVIYVGLNRVVTDLNSLKQWLTSDKFNDDIRTKVIRFVNLAPYARKLEYDGQTRSGIKSRIKMQDKRKRGGRHIGGGRVQAPSGTYYIMAKRFKKMMEGSGRSEFEFLPGDYAPLDVADNAYSPMGKRRLTRFQQERWGRGKGAPYLYPTIVVRFVSDDDMQGGRVLRFEQ